MRSIGETRTRSAWMRAAEHLGRHGPETTIDPMLRSLCMSGEKALTLISRSGQVRAHFGTPLEPESYVAWRTSAISIFLHGDIPTRLNLKLGAAGTVIAKASWDVGEPPYL